MLACSNSLEFKRPARSNAHRALARKKGARPGALVETEGASTSKRRPPAVPSPTAPSWAYDHARIATSLPESSALRAAASAASSSSNVVGGGPLAAARRASAHAVRASSSGSRHVQPPPNSRRCALSPREVHGPRPSSRQ
eukprot:scaffold265306_cov29-Tisochrysis_lutea.AAC.2